MKIHSIPILGEFAITFKKTIIDQITWSNKKRNILEKVQRNFNKDRSLDVSIRYDNYVFHDKNNSLIKRGEKFEPEITECLSFLFNLDKLRGNNTRFADIGANIGLHTFFTIKHFPDIDISAFDPSPSSWTYLELSLKYNNVENVTLYKLALSDSNGHSEFYNWGDESSGDSIKNTGRIQSAQPNIITVDTKKLDDIPIDFTVYKLDCEGAELSILNGARDTIMRNKPLMVCEFNPINIKSFSVTVDDIFTFLGSTDYSIYSLGYCKLAKNDFLDLQNNFEENYILLPNGLMNS